MTIGKVIVKPVRDHRYRSYNGVEIYRKLIKAQDTLQPALLVQSQQWKL